MVSSFEAYSIWIVTVLQSWMHCYNGITHPPFGSSFLHSQQQMHYWIVTKWMISFTHFQTITLPFRFEWVQMLPAAINIQFLHEYATTMIPQPFAPILPFQVLESLHYHELNPILATTMNQVTTSWTPVSKNIACWYHQPICNPFPRSIPQSNMDLRYPSSAGHSAGIHCILNETVVLGRLNLSLLLYGFCNLQCK